MIEISILGSTGSIGVSTLDVVSRHPERFSVFALTACRNVTLMAAQCARFEPRYAVMSEPDAAEALRTALTGQDCATEVLGGAQALETVAAHPEVDYVMAAIVGAPGLKPNLAAAAAGKRVMLANKEALVMSGQLFMDAAAAAGAVLLPVDSEHNAVFQAMPDGYVSGQRAAGVDRVVLTASGGPFRTTPVSELAAVTPDEACAHPNWDMGRKISVDSATMMNKGLEVIEACWLFAMAPSEIEVVVHPQSVIHSLVAYADGSLLAQLGRPDMRTPIAHALAWPARLGSGVERLDLTKVRHLEFEAPDEARFPCLRLAREAMAAGGTASAVLNAANEEAVAAFLAGNAAFTDIPRLVEAALDTVTVRPATTLAAVLEADAEARTFLRSRLELRNAS